MKLTDLIILQKGSELIPTHPAELLKYSLTTSVPLGLKPFTTLTVLNHLVLGRVTPTVLHSYLIIPM